MPSLIATKNINNNANIQGKICFRLNLAKAHNKCTSQMKVDVDHQQVPNLGENLSAHLYILIYSEILTSSVLLENNDSNQSNKKIYQERHI